MPHFHPLYTRSVTTTMCGLFTACCEIAETSNESVRRGWELLEAQVRALFTAMFFSWGGFPVTLVLAKVVNFSFVYLGRSL